MFKVIKSYPKIFLFGLITCFYSGFGQTYLFAQFIPYIKSDLNIGRDQMSTLYALATFLSSLLLPKVGKVIDLYCYKKTIFWCAIFLSIGFFVLGNSLTPVSIFVGFFICRLFGQTTLGLIATTMVAKLFGPYRGRTSSLIQIGRPLAEGVLPIVAVALILNLGYRHTFFIYSASVAIIYLPLSLYLLNRQKLDKEIQFDHFFQEQEGKGPQTKHSAPLENNFPGPFKDLSKLALFFSNAIIPFILTGLFFHQDALGHSLNLSPIHLAKGLTFYALGQFFMSLLSGIGIDRWTATRIVPFCLIPFLLGLFVLLFWPGITGYYTYLTFTGLSVGFYGNVRNNVWVEVYGARRLGQIRSVDASISVIGTSLAPIVFSYLLEKNIPMTQIIHWSIIIIFLGSYFYFGISRYYLRIMKKLEQQQNLIELEHQSVEP